MDDIELDLPYKHSNFYFPKPELNINREYAISDCMYKINKGDRNIFITGEPGIGKTVFLTQLTEQLDNGVITLFLNPISGFSCDEEIIKQDISEQLSWMIYNRGLDDRSSSGKDIYSKLCSSLARHCNAQKLKTVFIIDGLDNLESIESVKSILNIIPFHLKCLTFIISTNQQFIYEKFIRAKSTIDYFPIPLMNKQECELLFSNIEKADVEKIVSAYPCIPEKLISIKRLIDKGFTVHNILEEYGEHNETILEAEFRLNKFLIDENKSLLSFLIFNPLPIEYDDFLDNFELDLEYIKSTFEKISFIKVDNGFLEIASPALKSYLKLELSNNRAAVQPIIDSFIKKKKISSENIFSILKYKQETEDFDGVVDGLSNESILDVYKENNSLNTLSQAIKIGIHSTADDRYLVDRIKFTQLNSLFKGVSEIAVLKSEIECYLKEEDYSSAINLANEITLIEDKIQILAMIATSQKSTNMIVNDDVLLQIEYLYSNLNIEHLDTETSMDISVSIFPIFPELSFKIISYIDKVGRSGGNKSDYAYARLYFEAVLKNKDELDSIDLDDFNIDDKFKDSVRKIKDFKAGASVENFFQEIENLEISNGDKIGLITEGLKAFPDYEGSQYLLSYCLDLITESADFASTCTQYKDLTTSFINTFDNEYSIKNYQQILNQLPRLEKTGPTVDYVALCLNLAVFESKNLKKTDRHKEVLNYVRNKIPDILVTLRSVMVIQSAWYDSDFKAYWGSMVEYKNSIFDDVLIESAQHFTLLKEVIAEEAKISLNQAVNWCMKLNTEARKNESICYAVMSHAFHKKTFDIDNVVRTIKKISSDYEYTRAARVIVSRLHLLDFISKSDFDKLRKLKNRITNNNDKSQFIAHLLCIIKLIEGDHQQVRINLIEELKESFGCIDADWNKVNAGFSLANILLKSECELATYLREEIKEIRNNSTIDVIEIKTSYSRCIELAIRVNNSLLKYDLYEGNIVNIISRINILSGNIEKSRLFSKLISSLQNNSFEGQANSVIEKHVLKLLDSYGALTVKEYSLVFFSLSPVIYKYDKDIFFNCLNKVSDDNLKNESLSITISNIFEKTMVFDPFYHTDKHQYKLSYLDVKNIFSLLIHISSDWLVFNNLRRLTFCLKSLCKGESFTATQKLEIEGFYDSIIELMPMEGGIKHDGYKLCIEALKLSYQNQKNSNLWIELIEKSRRINNLADSIYTESCILELSTNLKPNIRKDLLVNLIEKTNLVNISIERIDLIETIYSSCKDICRSTVKRALKDALFLTTSENTYELQKKMRGLIDSFFEIDPKLSTTLTSLTDGDPYRSKLITENIEFKKKQDKLTESFSDFGSKKLDLVDQDEFSKYCNDQLAKLNSNKAVRRKTPQLLEFMRNIDNLDAGNLHVVLSFFVQAYADNFKKKNVLHSNLQPIFDSFISNSSMFCEVYKIKTTFNDSQIKTDDSIVLDIGDEEYNKAVDFIKSWVEDSKLNEVFISEPYFNLQDLNFIVDSLDRDFSLDIKIITSLSVYETLIKGMKDNGGFDDLDDYIESYWIDNICPDKNPRIEFFFAGTKINKEPLIHDRWWLNGKGVGGIKLGTSINGIGKKYSGINILNSDDAANVFSRMNNIASKIIKDFKGEKVVYKTAMIN